MPNLDNSLKFGNKSLISDWSFPSTRYIDLTLEESGHEYTAPATGWVVFVKQSGGSDQNVVLEGVAYGISRGDNGKTLGVAIPILKGQNYFVHYTATKPTEKFRFYYAEGV